MATPAQIEANRRNAQKSTGPTTAAGKAVASRNSVTHGLWANAALIDGEDAETFDSFAAGLRDELSPVGSQQEMLTERIVHLWWKIRRIAGLERSAVARLIAERPVQEPPVDTYEMMVIDLMGPRSIIGTLHGHELRLVSSLRATMRELRDLQAMEAESEDRFESEATFKDMLRELRRNEPKSAVSHGGKKASPPPPRAEPAPVDRRAVGVTPAPVVLTKPTPIVNPVRPPQVSKALSAAVSAGLGTAGAGSHAY